MEYQLKILKITQENPSTKSIQLEKPESFSFVPGHSVMVGIDKQESQHIKKPLTFTSIANDKHLEFFVKSYPERKSFNNLIYNLNVDDTIMLSEQFGTIRYTSSGIFIAGGIGIAPFLAIFRHLSLTSPEELKKCTLIYSVKRKSDIIREKELSSMLGKNLLITLTQEKETGYLHGRITSEFLKEKISNFSLPFYVIGSDEFVSEIKKNIYDCKLK